MDPEREIVVLYLDQPGGDGRIAIAEVVCHLRNISTAWHHPQRHRQLCCHAERLDNDLELKPAEMAVGTVAAGPGTATRDAALPDQRDRPRSSRCRAPSRLHIRYM
jgi:hypothetical protein